MLLKSLLQINLSFMENLSEIKCIKRYKVFNNTFP